MKSDEHSSPRKRGASILKTDTISNLSPTRNQLSNDPITRLITQTNNAKDFDVALEYLRFINDVFWFEDYYNQIFPDSDAFVPTVPESF